MRKTALVLGEVERELLAHPEAGAPGTELGLYASGLAKLFLNGSEFPQSVVASALPLAEGTVPDEVIDGGTELLRAVDALRHALIAATGQAPADWDLIDPATGKPDASGRRVRPGMRAYLEDLRSPFNVGAVFRTADAFGLEELLLSQQTADPSHRRAERSAMGAIGLVSWRRAGLDCIKKEEFGPAFALELGGTPIDQFEFPERGIVVLGSEELGVSPEAVALCSLGKVSIPMSGAKGSLNAAVAFGILMYAWSFSIERRSPGR